MTEARASRQRTIAELIRAEPLASQEEVTARLRDHGYAVTQATVSRDLDQMGAVKVKRGGVMTYALPDQVGESDWAAARLRKIFTDWVFSIEAAGSLLVLRTPPGSAHLVGLAIDQAKLAEVAGTICGDDTLFIALRDGAVPEAVASRFREMASG